MLRLTECSVTRVWMHSLNNCERNVEDWVKWTGKKWCQYATKTQCERFSRRLHSWVVVCADYTTRLFMLQNDIIIHLSRKAQNVNIWGRGNLLGAAAALTIAPKVKRSRLRPLFFISLAKESAASHWPACPHAWIAELNDISFGYT